ncbi:MAG: hypothetical protein ACO4AJ_04545 [Prochlorothrix sp.]
MRYNPASDKARDIDAIAAECRAATAEPARPQPEPAPAKPTTNTHLLNVYTESLQRGNRVSRHFYEFLQLTVAMDVAEAMGNKAERRRLGAMLIADKF